MKELIFQIELRKYFMWIQYLDNSAVLINLSSDLNIIIYLPNRFDIKTFKTVIKLDVWIIKNAFKKE